MPQRTQEDLYREQRAAQKQKATPPLATIQRDTTDLGKLAKSLPLRSRDLRQSKPVGLARPAARSLSR